MTKHPSRTQRHRAPCRALVLVALALLGVLAGCGAPAGSGPARTLAPDAPVPTSPVEGVVVRVETTGLNDFRGFQLRTDTGDVYVFTLGRLENATEFPPNHLPEHMAAADRLRVSFEVADGALVVHRIDHAHVEASPG